MRRAVVPACSILVLVSRLASAQFPLQSANGTSGLLGANEAGLINYDISDSRVGFKFVTGTSTTGVNDPYTSFVYDAGFTIDSSKRDIFKSGSFTPGFDFAFTTVYHFRETSEGKPAFKQVFVRGLLKSAAQKIVEPDGANLKVDTAAGTTAGVGTGLNIGITERVIWGVSVVGERFWNDTHSLDTRNVCVQEQSGTQADGSAVTVSNCDDRYIGPLANTWGGQVRSDFSWEIRDIGKAKDRDDVPAKIGVLASGSADLAQHADASFNASVGPAVYSSNNSKQVLFAGLVEWIDIGNRLGQSPHLSDQLRFRVYVGIPFTLLKSH